MSFIFLQSSRVQAELKSCLNEWEQLPISQMVTKICFPDLSNLNHKMLVNHNRHANT